MTVPTVHLNGTSKAELLAQIEQAYGAIAAAIKALGNAHPNARDYYVQEPAAITAATNEHRSRVDRLVAVNMELHALHVAIDKQGSR